MNYVLNGGRNERGVMIEPAALELYQQLDIKRILFIAYAMVEDQWQREWHESVRFIDIPGIEQRSLTTYNSDPAEIKSSLEWADFVYMPGGSQKALLNRMRAYNTHEMLKERIASGQLKLLGGGSAGAMVMGTWCMIGHKNVEAVVPGLDYLPGYVIDSHFSERNRLTRLQEVLQDKPGIIGMGIDEDTAVVFDRQAQIKSIFGPGTVTVCNNEVTVYGTNNSKTI